MNPHNPLNKPKQDPSAASKVQNGAKVAYWGYKAFQALAVRSYLFSMSPHVPRCPFSSRLFLFTSTKNHGMYVCSST